MGRGSQTCHCEAVSYTHLDVYKRQVYRHGVAAIDYGYENGRLATLDRKTYRSGAAQHQIYSFGYNQWGQATSIGVSSPDVSTPWVLMENVYAANNGLLDSTTYGNGTVVEYTYDRLDRVTRMVYSGGRYVNYRYNAEGSLAELDYGEGDAAPTATYRFEYDSLGRLIRSQQRDGNTVTQRTEQLYDTANRLSAQGWTIGGTSYRESYAYDASDGSLTTLNTCLLYTSTDRFYRFSLRGISVDTKNPDNVGIWALFLLQVDQPTDYAYCVAGEDDMVGIYVDLPAEQFDYEVTG